MISSGQTPWRVAPASAPKAEARANLCATRPQSYRPTRQRQFTLQTTTHAGDACMYAVRMKVVAPSTVVGEWYVRKRFQGPNRMHFVRVYYSSRKHEAQT